MIRNDAKFAIGEQHNLFEKISLTLVIGMHIIIHVLCAHGINSIAH